MPAHETSWRDSIARLAKALEVPDVRKRLFWVAAFFALYVMGLHTPAPFVNTESDGFRQLMNSGFLGMVDILSGGAFKRLSILALGIVPYINASIIMQLLGMAVPAIQRMQREGETGRKVLSAWTRWGTLGLALLQAVGLGAYLIKVGAVDQQVLGVFAIVPLVVAMAAGTSFLMWMGEQITDRGIGNGVSLIIFAGIMIRMPSTFGDIMRLAWVRQDENMAFATLTVVLLVAVFLGIVVFITWVHQATRQIPIQHAKRAVGSRVFSSSGTYLPLKVVTAGVIPIIFAISVVMVPPMVAGMLAERVGENTWWIKFMVGLSPGQTWYGAVIYFLLVVFFTYFYTAVVYNVQDIADNLKKQGSFIPGLRPGKQTERYIDQVLTRITFAGAIFLGLVALLPYLIPVLLRGAAGAEANLFPLWGGTSLLIVVGVALETMKQLEAHLVMHRHEGFIR